MVRWYSPIQLFRTGVEALVANLVGRRGDYRLVETGGEPEDYSTERGLGEAWRPVRDIWFDFVADTGEGWNPTYAIASLIAQPALEIPGREQPLPHGRFLVLGGDAVYPVADREAYRERLVAPFKAALPSTAPARDLYAIPGNHDWYDGLAAFSRLFTTGKSIGGWRTRQRASYFALKLPQRWWLWAADTQLEWDVDIPQRTFFANVAARLRPHDRVILVCAKPEWLVRDVAGERHRVSGLGSLETLVTTRGASVLLWLAGDFHHYRRHELLARSGNLQPTRQRISSGGGGAFLCLTHGPLIGAARSHARQLFRVGDDAYVPCCRYPSAATSFRLSLLNFLFMQKNWTFGVVTGVLYAAFTWAPTIGSWIDRVMQPAVLVPGLFVVWLTWLFAALDEESPRLRHVVGPLHGLAHIAAALLIADWAITPACVGAWPVACRLGLNFLAGALIGSTVFGIYLFLALTILGAHLTQASSSLRIQDYKHFLRLHIRRDGVLEIFPIAIGRVPRRREARARYHLIEEPIRVDPRQAFRRRRDCPAGPRSS
jgi:hypothetical protein